MSICYVRQVQVNEWVRARSHHNDAIISFLNTPHNLNDPHPIYVCVPHEDGGDFVAEITRVNEVLFYYVENGYQVEIIRVIDPAYIRFLNALMH